ncbi:hypothetical protein [Thiomicrorhabdus indica]|uniref:hypothetical protein n=1 Tax=Thiomicrorhabdus indica TaxID=2267253 RepID=UPI002AA8ECFB|nr:hypothetical protein [Thiomicrorhabdus indica]
MATTINPNSMIDRLVGGTNSNKDKAHAATDDKISSLLNSNAQSLNSVPQDTSSISAAMIRQAEQAYGYSQTMSLQLTTKEGDQVSVDFRQLYTQYQSYKEAVAGQQNPSGVRYFESREALEMTAFEERFAFSVEGDLNEDELKAVFDVFEQVDKLSDQFYGGNIEQALQEAMNMEIDFGQLQGMQLSMTQTQVAMSRQQQAAAAEYEATPDKATVAELPEYLQKWQEAIESLDQWFEDAQGAWNELMAGVTSQRFPEQDSPKGWFERVQEFHGKLSEMANLRNETLNSQDEPVVEEPVQTDDVVNESANKPVNETEQTS